MSITPHHGYVAAFQQASKVASGVTMLIGGVVLVGWWRNIAALTSIVPGWATMKANTALAFFAAGLALWLLHIEVPDRRVLFLRRACALLITLIGVLTLSEYVFGWELGIDQLLVRQAADVGGSAPGRMAPITAVNFLLLGIALSLLDIWHHDRTAQFMTLIVTFFALLALMGYLYGVAPLYRIASYTAISLHTATTFLMLCLGILLVRPDHGWMAMLTRDSADGVLARRLLPAAVGVPMLFGWAALLGQKMGLYDGVFGLALFAIASIVVFTLLIARSAVSLYRIDVARQHAEDSLRRVNSDLDGRVLERTAQLAHMNAQLTGEVLERKRAEAQFRGLLEAAPDAIVIINQQGSITLINSQLDTLFGYPRDVVLGKSVEMLLPERFRSQHAQHHTQYFTAPRTQELGARIEIAGLRQDGTEFPMEISLSSVEAAEGLLVTAAIRDITERKRAEVALRQSEERFRLVVEGVRDYAILMLDPTGHVISWNLGAERIKGYQAAEIIGHHFSRFYPAADVQQGKPDQGLAIAVTEGSFHEQGVRVRKDGSAFIADVTITALYDDAGALRGFAKVTRDITDHTRTEAMLMHERDLMQALMDNIPDTIYFKDTTSRFTRINHAQVRMLGVDDARAAIGKTDADFQAPHLAAAFYAEEQYLLQTGRSIINREEFNPTAGGEPRWLASTKVPMYDQHGQVRGLIGISHDITAQKQIELALRETELRFRTLVEQLPVITYIAALDETSSTIYTSPQIEAMLGFTQIEWMADHDLWRKQIYPDDLPAVLATIERSHATGTSLPSEYRMLTRTGEVKWFRDQSMIVKDDAHQSLFLQGIMFDITASKQVEEALHRSEMHNQALINAVPDVMFRFSRAGVYLDCRANDTRDLVQLPADMLGKTLADVLPPDLTRVFMTGIDRAFDTGIVQSIEYQHVVNEDVREFEARIVMCGKNEVLAIVRNITIRKQIERMKNEFVATVSHELRTPLTSIRGALGLIAGGVAGVIPIGVQRMVDIACTNSDRLIRLINDILDSEKIESGKLDFIFQPTALLPLVAQAIEANRAYGAQFNMTFVLKCTAPNVGVNVDSDRLIQALTNLLANAAKFSPAGGSVLVEVRQMAALIRVAISDQGPGVPDAFRAELFQKFAQADSSDTRQRGGTGLGLSITKAIIERLDGQVAYAPNPHGGATFWIELPIWYAPPSDAESDP